MRVKITSALHIFKDPVSAVCSMVKRYGREVTGECQICGFKGSTQIHHIISQAKSGRLKPNQHGHDLNLIENPGNLAELCVPCHELTDSHFYRRLMEKVEAENEREPPNVSEGEYPGGKWKFQCIGIAASSGKRCRRRRAPKGGYCPKHLDQAPSGHYQHDFVVRPMPPLRGWWDGEDDWKEPVLDAEHMAALAGIHRLGEEVDDYVLELFEEWPEAWHRRWLRLEKW